MLPVLGVLHWKIEPPIARPPKARRPLRDEWGIYDPAQAGLEALIRKLMLDNDDEPGESEPDPKTPGRSK